MATGIKDETNRAMKIAEALLPLLHRRSRLTAFRKNNNPPMTNLSLLVSILFSSRDI